MSQSTGQLSHSLRDFCAGKIISLAEELGEVTLEVAPGNLIEIATALRDLEQFSFVQLTDLCGVDYSQFGQSEWQTDTSSRTGFGRGVDSAASAGRLQFGDELDSKVPEGRRFAVVYHLLSYQHNHRLRLRVYAGDNAFPMIPTVTDIWHVANWYEREAFDLFGILFSGHPDLRRILTDYGFVGHPFRKDFPLVGHVEMRYEPEKGRVIYEPVSIEPRVLVPRVKREDHRYLADDPQDEGAQDA